MGAVGIGEITFAKVTKTHMVVAVAIDNTAVLAGPDLEDIDIPGVQFSQGKGPHLINSVIAIVVHHIVENHHPVSIGIDIGVQR